MPRKLISKTVESISVKEGENIADKNLRKDDILVDTKIVPLHTLLPEGMGSRKGYEQAVISNGKIVNIVGENYGHLPNRNFFTEMDIKLVQADVKYETRSFNKDDRQFAVDYILNDDSFVTKVKNEKDEIIPMIRLVNSYDSSTPTIGSFGFFRKVCNNGLHIAQTQIGFKVRHTSAIDRVVMPEMDKLIEAFMNNEFYTLSKKFEVLAERTLSTSELEDVIKNICDNTGVFKFTKSEKTNLVGLNVQTVLDTIDKESKLLDVQPNLWLTYNSVNELLHNKFDKNFDKAKTIDENVFNHILTLA